MPRVVQVLERRGGYWLALDDEGDIVRFRHLPKVGEEFSVTDTSPATPDAPVETPVETQVETPVEAPPKRRKERKRE